MNKNNLKITTDFINDDNSVNIGAFSITYEQNADCNSKQDDIQTLTITARNNGLGEDGWYCDIKINVHWSTDDPKQLTYLINDFWKRFNYNTVKNKSK